MGRVSSPVFIGREAELRRVRALVEQARAGRSVIVLIGGEAGVGKTRFVHEITATARADGFRVLEGGCVQLGAEHLPYGPLVEALRPIPPTLADDELAMLVGTGGDELAPVMPGLRLERGPRPGVDASSGQVFEQLLHFLDRLASRAPVLLVIEDIHWADPTTLEFLAFAARNLREAPVALLATYRTDELTRHHPVRPLLAELERSGSAARVVLDRFDRRELAAQLEGIRGESTDPDLVAAIFDRSEGNAFLAEELLAADASGLPDALQDLLLIRVAALSPDTQELVRMASVGGPRFDSGTVAAVAGTRISELEGALREAVDGHVIVPSPVAADRYAFRHSLLREAIYADLLPGQRTRLHARYAEVLTARGDGEGDAGRTAELAYHWLEARDLPRAFEASVRAGIAADAMYALPDARVNYERALELWDVVADAAARSPVDRVDLLLRLAYATVDTSPGKAAEYLRAAIELAEEESDPERAALLQAFLGWFTFRDREEAVAEIRAAIDRIPRDPPSPPRARALIQLGTLYVTREQAMQAVPVLEEALAASRDLAASTTGGLLAAVGLDLTTPRRVESLAQEQLSLAVAFLGDIDGALARVAESRAISIELGIQSRVAETWFVESEILGHAGRFADAVGPGLRGAEHAAAHGMAGFQGAISLFFAARSLFALGRWSEAGRHLEQAFREVRNSPALTLLEGALARLAVAEGRPAEAAQRLARTRQAFATSVWPLTVATHAMPRGELALWSGEPASAREVVAATIPRLRAGTPPRIGHLGPVVALGMRAEADLARAGRARADKPGVDEAVTRARDLFGLIIGFADDTARHRPALSRQAEAWRTLCEAELRRAESTPDPDAWAASAAAWHALRMPWEQGYALLREGQAAVAAGRPRASAAEAFRAAHEIAAALPSPPLLDRLDDAAARAGVHFRQEDAATLTSVRKPADAPGIHGRQTRGGGRYVLTGRELEILDLLTSGRTDGEIAERLFISKKTVSVHVNNIKGKLAAESRVGIVTAAISRGLVQNPLDRADVGDAV